MLKWISYTSEKWLFEGSLVALVFFVLAVLGGVVYPLIFLCVCARKGIKKRRENRRAIERRQRFF